MYYDNVLLSGAAINYGINPILLGNGSNAPSLETLGQSLFIGLSSGWPFYVDWVRVWQAPGASAVTHVGGSNYPVALQGSGSIKDAGGNTWTITAGGTALINGVQPAGESTVAGVYNVNGTIWVVTAGQPNWYYYTPTGTNVGTFTAGSNPL
jgi:hypothetical protein